jgi:hypothetical protein
MRCGARSFSALMTLLAVCHLAAQSPRARMATEEQVQPAAFTQLEPPSDQLVTPASYAQSSSETASNPQAAQPQPCSDLRCPQCHFMQCECPQKPAPCQPCPHVSTLLPNWNVNIFGALQGNVMFNTARPVASGIPMFLAPKSAEPENTVDVFARPSNLGAIFTGPEVCGFRSGGMFWAFLYNDALIVDRYGVLPVQAWGELKNDDWRFAAGLQFNVFCPNAPTMLTFSMLIGSGDAGNNFPGQFRIERYLHPSSDSQWTFQFALSDPVPTGIISKDPISAIITGTPATRLNEDNGWPSLEGRIAYSIGELKQEGLEQKRAVEIGASVVGTQLRTVIAARPNVIADSFGLGADFRWRINDCWGVVGEAFIGQGLGFLNAGVLQSTNSTTFEAIRTRGAWAEVYDYITPCLHTHWGAGIDDPTDRDLADAQISQNVTAFANLIWDVTHQFRIGFELTWRKTDYIQLRDNDGFGIHTQVQWSF